MVERSANIGPRHAVRLSDLERWHVLTAVCRECRHRRQMRLWQLTAGRPHYTHLTEIEGRLRCQKCGNRESNRVLVTMAERD
jgi:DNA-directed RNA polymerase subunit RPC12/RpoP